MWRQEWRYLGVKRGGRSGDRCGKSTGAGAGVETMWKQVWWQMLRAHIKKSRGEGCGGWGSTGGCNRCGDRCMEAHYRYVRHKYTMRQTPAKTFVIRDKC